MIYRESEYTVMVSVYTFMSFISYSGRLKFIMRIALARDATCCEKAMLDASSRATIVSVRFILYTDNSKR